jgi:hypothetical protein
MPQLRADAREAALTVDDRTDQQDNRTIARRLVMELAQGCGDHSCRFNKPSGMGTNGGCRCIDKIEDALSRRSTVTPAEERIDEFAYQIHESFHVGCPSDVRLGCIDFIKRKLTRFIAESQTSSPAPITEGSARELGPHDWTHPVYDCDEPGCDHITRRTCEGAEKTIKFLRDLLAKRTARLANADPAWAAQAARNVFRAVGYTDEEIDAIGRVVADRIADVLRGEK